jgi:uncharacterized cupin superfamily protein
MTQNKAQKSEFAKFLKGRNKVTEKKKKKKGNRKYFKQKTTIVRKIKTKIRKQS